MNFSGRLFRRLAGLLREARQERGLSVLSALPLGVWRLLSGRLAAWHAGFPAGALGPGARVIGRRHIQVGRHASIKRMAWIEAVSQYGAQAFTPSIRIGARFLAFDRLHISAIASVAIGDDCLFGSGVYIADHNHGVYRGADQSAPEEAPAARRLQADGPVRIGHRVWLGDNVVVVGAVQIGDGAIVGANTVVTRDVPAGVMAAGAPMQFLKQYNPQTRQWERHPQLPSA